jgi:PEP-CTERM motif-containing protein
MRKIFLLLWIALITGAGWLMTPSRAEAISCISVSDVTALPAAGCDFGGLTFSDFRVSGSAGFSAATVGLGSSSTASPTNVNLIYQLSTTPGAGPGDVLLSYAVKAAAGLLITGIDLTNDAIMGPVTIGELACRVAFSPSGTCAPADRLAALVAGVGERKEALFASPVDFVFLHKDINVGVGGFISDFSNSHSLEPVPEPGTLLLLGSTLAGLGAALRRHRHHRSQNTLSRVAEGF